MKYVGLFSLLLLAGCQSTPSFCEKEPDSNLCDQSTYTKETLAALKEFESRKNIKAFALGKADDGWEFYGYSEGYGSTRDAEKAALKACQQRLFRHSGEGKCELIR